MKDSGAVLLWEETMTITLAETKTYLRVDYTDDDSLIQGLIDSAIDICADVSRHTVEEYIAATDEKTHIALLYTVAYLYEHREEADHKKLKLDLWSILEGYRKAAF